MRRRPAPYQAIPAAMHTLLEHVFVPTVKHRDNRGDAHPAASLVLIVWLPHVGEYSEINESFTAVLHNLQ